MDFRSLHSPKGRLGRLSFLNVIASILVVTALALKLYLVGLERFLATEDSMLASLCLYLLFNLELVVILLFATARRAHDVGWSGHVAWLTLVPYLGGFVFFHLVMREPHAGPNKYGPCPKPESPEMDRE